MTELKARYIALCIIAAEVIACFFIYVSIILGYKAELSKAGNGIDGIAVAVLVVFLCIGTAIILSARFRVVFYIFSVIEMVVVFSVFFSLIVSFLLVSFTVIGIYSTPSPISLTLIPVFLALVAPHALYWYVRIQEYRRRKPDGSGIKKQIDQIDI